MYSLRKPVKKPVLRSLLATLLIAPAFFAHAAGEKAEVLHWWTSGGESAAVAKFAGAYRAAGGIWTDTAIAGGDQARSVAINRMVGGNPPTAAQFNVSRQFQDIVDQGMLSNVDEVASKENWDKILPEPIRDSIRIKGHYYAVPVNIHMPAWIWYSKSAFKKAGIDKEPATPDEMFAALDKLKAAGLIPLAHGGQPWQETIVFLAMLANVGGKDLYLRVIRDRDAAAMNTEAFRKVLLSFKRLKSYVDTGSPGRNWNDSTALLISGKAGMQIMGDWVMGEFVAARQVAGREFGCIPGLGQNAPYLIQGDVFVFPKTANADQLRSQKLLAGVLVNPVVQVEFNKLKGSIPVRSDLDASQMNLCARTGMEIMKDKSRHVGIGEVYLTPDQNGALTDALTAYWNTNIPVEKVQKSIASALRN
ncbi:ABC transporter substrate-binding protein [Undibacterium sp. TS12]|uniref:ABC transporter substrate-binding protein n=1 Tax=Undibacterium sp. TS12 TaxID=2908202 RepID=UPI001F4CA8C3|nr:ABC transporter substrate-binding protein [Undibacterium sp. TS12]MCH8617957.1 ABC transporter substrate-binding protein [Undibacterium sp. TS12]